MSSNYMEMVCLVGENPLPVYLGVRQLAAPNAVITLVHTGEKGTEFVARKIQGKLHNDRPYNPKDGSGHKIKMTLLSDPHCPKTVREKLKQLKTDNPNAALNYTGGTKVMAAYSLLEWQDSLDKTFYLEEADKLFHIGDSDRTEPLDVPLTVTDLCKLHEMEPRAKELFSECSREDLVQLWEALLEGALNGIYYRASNLRNDAEQYKWLKDEQYDAVVGQWHHIDQFSEEKKKWLQRNLWYEFIKKLTLTTQKSWLTPIFPAHPRKFQVKSKMLV